MNQKKIAASIAALGAVTFAHAANVEFYGSIDNSVSYIKAKGQNGQASMYASNDSSPKLGLTGKEDIGNGHFVRFKLENGYSRISRERIHLQPRIVADHRRQLGRSDFRPPRYVLHGYRYLRSDR